MSDELPEDQHEVSDGTFEFRGRRLEPFSFDRQSAAQRISDNSGAENDALLVFLCLTSLQKVRQLREDARIAAFRAELAEWCDKEKITIHGRNKGRQEISRIANQIYADMAAVDFEPEIKGETKGPDPNATG